MTRISNAVNPTEPARVLLADDDPDFRSLVAVVLRDDGYEVVEADDGTELLDRLAEAQASAYGVDSYDLVVTDVRMPGYDAFDVMSAMRRAMADTPFVLITGSRDAATREQAETLGAVALLDKPIDVDQLRTVVAHALRHRPPLPY